MSALARHVTAALSMVAGSALVFGLVWGMNAYGTPPPKADEQASASFHVEKQKPKPKPQRKRKVRKAKATPRSAAPAPAPNLSAGLAGLELDLPAFDMDEMMGSGAQDLLGQTEENQVMTADSVDNKPEPRRRVQPQFPERARRKGIEGFVKLSMLIGSDGDVQNVKVLESEPRGIFEEPAVAAVKQWEYQPATYQGSPVKIWVEQRLQFRLN